MLLADVRPYIGWYLLLAVAIGIAIAVALPWAIVRGARGSGRWTGWLLFAYTAALVGGMRYYLSLRFTPPGNVPAAQPPLWLVLEIAGLSAVAVTFAAITLLILVTVAEVIAPGPIGRWLRAPLTRRSTARRRPGPVEERIPARLRPEAPDGAAGGWLRGAIHVRPGSLLWEPATGVRAAPAELTAAVIVPDGAARDAKRGRAVTLDTPSGRIQLECGAEIFTLLQHIATDLAKSSHAKTTPDEH
ncbi:MAG TPA: hypothetical protein VF060_10050 [Trebonia sp.]